MDSGLIKRMGYFFGGFSIGKQWSWRFYFFK